MGAREGRKSPRELHRGLQRYRIEGVRVCLGGGHREALGSRLWALGSRLWALGSGLWALGSGL